MKKIFCLVMFISLFISCDDKKLTTAEQIASWKAKAQFFYKNKNFGRAIPYYTSLIKIDSTNGEYFFKRAYSYGQIGQKFKSIHDNLDAIELNYHKELAYFNIAAAYMFNNDTMGIYYLQKCLEVNPNDTLAIYLIENARMRIRRNQQ